MKTSCQPRSSIFDLRSALIYPALFACVGLAIVVFFMSYMLPKFLSIFEGMKVQLPASTQFLIRVSHFFSNPIDLAATGLFMAVAAVLFIRFRASKAGRRSLDGWKMKAPVIGKLVKLNLFGQFARTLASRLHDGVPVLTALEITEQVVPNVLFQEAIARMREEVTDGKSIAQSLACSKIFPQRMIDVVKGGEDAGDVPGALENVANTYENELSVSLRVMTNLIEPAMIVVIAIFVGFLLFSVLNAMLTLTANIGK